MVLCSRCGGPTQPTQIAKGKWGPWIANSCAGLCKDASGRFPLHTPNPQAPVVQPAVAQPAVIQPVTQPTAVQPQVVGNPPTQSDAVTQLKMIHKTLCDIFDYLKIRDDSLEKENRRLQQIAGKVDLPKGEAPL